jgi:hypothetical protein
MSSFPLTKSYFSRWLKNHQPDKSWENPVKTLPFQERFKVAMLSAHRTGELQKVAEKLATEVQRRIPDFF